MTTNDIQTVAEALDWAYRQGYSSGTRAAEAFARLHNLKLGRIDLGQYGDKLDFQSGEQA